MGNITQKESAMSADLAEVNGARTREPLLEVRNLTHEYIVRGHGGVKGGVVQAVSNVSFDIGKNETLGVVGETGCGKSTMARAVLQYPKPKSGEVVFRGQDLVPLHGEPLRQARRHIQMVAQDPYSSLDPKWRVERLVEEPLTVFDPGTGTERRGRVSELLELVGLDPHLYGSRRPRDLSGGQCQRVAIARALALSPELLVCDEAVSSLDVSIQAQILNLFETLKAELSLSYLFIAHDLSVVKHLSDRVAVMYLGTICEISPADEIFVEPRHPYTAALLWSIPGVSPAGQSHVRLSGEPPAPIDPPTGCRFHTRCPLAVEQCALEVPELREISKGHQVACHFPIGLGGPDIADFEHRAESLWGAVAGRSTAGHEGK
jgi:oligopeptide/dipeptide ABC transporter ATP-binding protein